MNRGSSDAPRRAANLQSLLSVATPLLPVAPIPRPVSSMASGSRSRHRHGVLLRARDEANATLRMLNALHAGLRKPECVDRRGGRRAPASDGAAPTAISSQITDAQARLHQVVLREAHRLERERQAGMPVGGARNLASLLKLDAFDRYSTKSISAKHPTLIAEHVDEPTHSSMVHLLEALPPEEAAFYSAAENVVSWEGKSESIFQELQDAFGFVGGSHAEYVAYMNRDHPPLMWEFVEADGVDAVAGLSVVAKKQKPKLRKLLMQCATNYVWNDVRGRENHGLLGGGALGRLHVEEDNWFVSSFDESNAFTSVVVPEWMRRWCCAPPVRAGDVWDKLSPDVRQRSSVASWIWPRYCRLAMGSSHSVHILMAINNYQVGKALVRSRRLGSIAGCCSDETDDEESTRAPSLCLPSEVDDDDILCSADLDDDRWCARHEARLLAARSEAEAQAASGHSAAARQGWTPHTWNTAVREAARLDERVFVCMHLFAGPERDDEIEEKVLSKAKAAGLRVLFCSVDVLRDSTWDLADPRIFHMLMLLAEEGLCDVTVAGPPCSTWS